jgi:hypothetical protein
MRLGLALCLLVAACRQEVPISNGGANEAQIQRLSTPKVEEVVDSQAAARLVPLAPADLAQAGMTVPLCDFSRDGRMLLAVTPSDAIARVAGTLLHFAHSSPAGPTGGFFEDRQVSVSVGRVGEVAPGEGAAGSWAGRITATNRRAHAQTDLNGIWRWGT